MPQYKYLTVRLRLEQQRLYNWSSEVGLVDYFEDVETTPSIGLTSSNRNKVLQTLEDLYSLALDFIKRSDNGTSLIPDDDESHAETQDEIARSLDRFPIVLTLFLKEAESAGPLIRRVPERLKWAGVYQDRYESLIDKFRCFNDILIDLVDSDARVAIRESTRENNIIILYLQNTSYESVNLTKALTPETPTWSLDSSPIASNPSDVEQKRDLLSLAHFKTVNTQVEDNTYFTSHYVGPLEIKGKELTEIRIARSDVQVLYDTSDRCEGEYHPSGGPRQHVWIEWREQDPIFEIRRDDKPSRVDKLVALLTDPSKPDLLRVPHCLGYFNDPKCKKNHFRCGRLGFIFEKPPNTTPTPVSLRELLETRSKPSLTERVALAKAILQSLMALHSVNWLHKNLRSHNIIFFPTPNYAVDYSCPYLSGFGYARPQFGEDVREIISQNPTYDMYRHPRTHGLGPWEGKQGFRRAYDVFSLGIVLVEIANWQTIDSVLEIADPSSLDAATLAGVQLQLLLMSTYMKNVKANAGVKFMYATWSCLNPEAALDFDPYQDEAGAFVVANFSKKFFQKVIKPLEEIQM